ncbi:MAG: extracellular solute-binding protein [Bifidobacteriaceae bacterium]|jgi:multiple sugar transport system substrate-binding protein|nr:extracellular solute-binding protein [Bifidobacteriaceae bacterium]
MGNHLRHRTAIGLGATLLLGLGVAACGTDEQPTGKDGNSGGSGEVQTITFWQSQFYGLEDEWYASRVADFNATHADIQVEYEVIPSDAWDQKLKAAQAAGTAPDVYTRAYNTLMALARSQSIRPLDDLLSESAWQDLEASVEKMVIVDGQHYAYPVLVEPSMVLWYRSDLFEQAGLDPDDPPTDWDGLIEVAERLKGAATDAPLAMPQRVEDLAWSTWGLQYSSADHLPLAGDWSAAQADDPAYKSLLDMYRALYADGLIPPQALDEYTAYAPYGEGKVAMMANGSWAAAGLLSDYPEIAELTRVAKFPSASGDDQSPTASLGGWTLVIDGRTESADAAGAFVEWMVAGEADPLVKYFADTSYSKFPARQSVNLAIGDTDEAAQVNPWRSLIASDVVPYSIAEPVYDWSVSLAFAGAIEAAMQGQASDEALRRAQEEITGIVDQLGIAGQGPE